MPLRILIEICLLRAGPQDLPASPRLMLAALAAYAAAGVLGVHGVVTFGSALLAAAADTLLLAGVTQGVLQWRGLENRVSQTLTALAGCGALLSLLAWAAAGLARELFQPQWIWAALLVWYTLVFGHVVRHALSLTLAPGVAAALLYLMLSIGITGMFLQPVPAAN